MYRIKITPSGRPFFGDLNKRATTEFRKQLLTNVKPMVQKEVSQRLSVEPPPVQHPFVFHADPIKNAKIRAAFFATKGFGRGLGAPRKHQASTSWFFDISFQLPKLTATIYNPKKYSKWLYPPTPFQIPGHIKTGWGKGFEQRFRYLESFIDNNIAIAWFNSILIAIGNG